MGTHLGELRAIQIRVIGDVHGEINSFQDSIASARKRGQFIVQLGDLIDHGPDGPACLSEALRLRRDWCGIFLRGNHEHDLAKYLLGRSTSPSSKLLRTVQQIRALPHGAELIAEFLDIWAEIPWWLCVQHYVLVHGAFHPAMLDHSSPNTIGTLGTRDLVKSLSLFGEGPIMIGDSLPHALTTG